eukprot:1098421-Rhodomonas_salina.1
MVRRAIVSCAIPLAIRMLSVTCGSTPECQSHAQWIIVQTGDLDEASAIGRGAGEEPEHQQRLVLLLETANSMLSVRSDIADSAIVLENGTARRRGCDLLVSGRGCASLSAASMHLTCITADLEHQPAVRLNALENLVVIETAVAAMLLRACCGTTQLCEHPASKSLKLREHEEYR